MKKFVIITLSVFVLGCGSENNHAKEALADSSAKSSHVMTTAEMFTLSDAEKILGEPAKLDDSVTSFNNGILRHNSSYAAVASYDRPVVIYFMFEEYPDAEAAKKSYASIKTSNEANGIEMLTGVCEEAYFHTDSENFYFILARKGTKMFRIKVNKLSDKTSKEEFMNISVNLCAAL
jgi:hypothetical protein